ncbi:hypothetical protein ACFLUZ_04910 [Chloroflexota bacterium]
MFIVIKGFEFNASINAQMEGVSDLPLVVFPLSAIPLQKEFEELKLGEKVTDDVIEALTQRSSHIADTEEIVEEYMVFSGSDYTEALRNMDKHFLQHCWSDGFPLVPPTEEAVNEMLEGTVLPRDYVVGLVEPMGGKATIEKIAINAVMAGCLPQYMPVIIAAVEAITDPLFDLRGVQCTAGAVSPLLILSGQELIKQLNVNDSFSTIGPGWRANATIGRAIRLIMINLGHTWPGKPDMKAVGNPMKYITLMAENEAGYRGAWEPIRVAEGFRYDQPTISVMPAVSWQPLSIHPDMATTDKVVDAIGEQGRMKYDRLATCWGMDNLVIISPTAFDVFYKEQRSRNDIQKALYEVIQSPCFEFYRDTEPTVERGPKPIPESIVAKSKADRTALVPLLLKPKSIKICVAGGSGPGFCAFVATWGFGPAHFVTKAISLPPNWENLLEKHSGWETPIVK